MSYVFIFLTVFGIFILYSIAQETTDLSAAITLCSDTINSPDTTSMWENAVEIVKFYPGATTQQKMYLAACINLIPYHWNEIKGSPIVSGNVTQLGKKGIVVNATGEYLWDVIMAVVTLYPTAGARGRRYLDTLTTLLMAQWELVAKPTILYAPSAKVVEMCHSAVNATTADEIWQNSVVPIVMYWPTASTNDRNFIWNCVRILRFEWARVHGYTIISEPIRAACEKGLQPGATQTSMWDSIVELVDYYVRTTWRNREYIRTCVDLISARWLPST